MSDGYQPKTAPHYSVLPGGEVLHRPPNTLLQIDELFVFASVDKEGNEGVCGMTLADGTYMPMVAADRERLATLRPYAQRFAAVAGIQIKLIRLSTRVVLETIEPADGNV